jgi:hypothetical protein
MRFAGVTACTFVLVISVVQSQSSKRPKAFSPRSLLIFALIAMSLWLSGCVRNRSYRRGTEVPQKTELPPSIEPLPSSVTDCSNLRPYECVHTPSGYQPQHFYLAHIEFDDMGELWSINDTPNGTGTSRSQLNSALTLIQKAQKEATEKGVPLVVITFVHGWHNNASPYDEANGNLGSFKSILQGFYAQPDENGERPVLVGVFLAWRGQSITDDFAFTYWGRRDAATRVGGPSMTEVVTRLMFETKGVPLTPEVANGCLSAERKPDSHFAIIAHSFGARALEHAITQPMLSMILERQMRARECADDWNSLHASLTPIKDLNFLAPADLIVFLNAANDAFEAKETIDALKRAHINVTRALRPNVTNETMNAEEPFMISITSDGDWATKGIMPLAQLFSSTTLSFRRYDKGKLCEDEDQLCDHSQRYYYRHSEASIKEMRSHVVIWDKLGQGCTVGKPIAWPYFWVESKKSCFCIDRNTKDHPQDKCQPPQDYAKQSDGRFQKSKFGAERVWNNTPFYVIGVPGNLIKDHNDIFQEGTIDLLMAISKHYGVLTGPPTRMTTPLSSAP